MEETSLSLASAGKEQPLPRSCNRALEHKEEQLAREALREQQVQQLTRIFRKQKEEQQREKSQKLASRARDNYERLMEKAKLQYQADEKFKDTVKLERREVNEIIAEKVKERQAEEESMRQEEERRRFLIQARHVHDKVRRRERRMQLEEQKAKHSSELRARLQQDDAARKELLEASRKDTEAAGEKLRLKLSKARERRQQAIQEKLARISLSELEAAQLRAEELRRQEQENLRKQREEAAEVRQQRLEEITKRAEAVQDEKHRQMLGKLRDVDARHEQQIAAQQEALASARKQRDARLEAAQAYRHEQQQKEQQQKEQQHQQHQQQSLQQQSQHQQQSQQQQNQHADALNTTSQRSTSSKPPASPQLDIIHKEYLARHAQLDHQEERMWVRKKYRAVADLAKSKSKLQETDIQILRLKAVHTSHAVQRRGAAAPEIGTTLRMPLSDSDDSHHDMKSQQLQQSSRSQQQSRLMQQCALCERAFPASSLPGKALSQAVQRAKSQDRWGDYRKRGPVSQTQTSFYSARGEGSDVRSAPSPTSPRTPRLAAEQTERRQLYDYEVPLCITCFHYLHALLM